MDNLADFLTVCADRQPEKPLLTFLDGFGQEVESYTYRQFDLRTNMVASRLVGGGHIEFGQPVLLVYEPGLEFVVAFFACIKAGAIPVPVPPPGTKISDRLETVAADCKAETVLSSVSGCVAAESRQNDPSRPADSLTPLKWVATDPWKDGLCSFETTPNRTLFLQYTSGSTQSPRGVIVSHDNVLHNGRAIQEYCSKVVTWLPHYHDMGLIGCYFNGLLAKGSVVAFSPNSFLKRPMLWLNTISRYQATATTAPNFAYAYVLKQLRKSGQELPDLDLSSLQFMLNAAEPVCCETMTEFRARLRPLGLSSQLPTVGFGLAENTLAVTMHGRKHITVDGRCLQLGRVVAEADAQPRPGQIQLASSGRPIDGCDVRIVDPERKSDVPVGRTGEIWTRGWSKAGGYYKKPELSRDVFDAKIAGREGEAGYLRTGDLGFIRDGELYVCGRLKDLIIVRGRNHCPQDIEAVVQKMLPDSRPGAVAAFAVNDDNQQDQPVVVAEVRPRQKLPSADAIFAQVRRQCSLELHELAFVNSGSIARTSSGKTARHECRRRWLAGDMKFLERHQGLAESSGELLLQDLLSTLDDPNVTLAEAGLDSLTLVSLSLYLRDLIDATQPDWDFDAPDLKLLQSVRAGELAAAVDRLKQGQPLQNGERAMFNGRLKAIEQSETQQLKSDARLPEDFVVEATGRPTQDGAILLTGATGFFGGFLLDALLRQTSHAILVLVRASDKQAARARIDETLRKSSSEDFTSGSCPTDRVRVICGDIALPQLGLSDDEWGELSQQVSAIYHNGAIVDYVMPYSKMRSANVLGTLELLKLARVGIAKSFHMISTTFIFGWSAPETLWECDSNAEMRDLDFGYAQSKWVSEQLVHQAAAAGLTARVYRPSLITASRHNHYVQRDIIARLLSYMIRHGVTVSSANQVSFLPADVAADNLVAISLEQPDSTASVHITAENYYNFSDVAGSITRQFGFEFEPLSIREFIDHLNAYCHDGDIMYPLVPFLNRNFARLERMQHKRYDSENYQAECRRSVNAIPEPPLDETVAAIVNFLQAENLIPPKPSLMADGPAAAAQTQSQDASVVSP